ncbi:hypothetical protein BV22DRAFT_1133152 [Leucogyrophana mollusca]|uniref:Uncharacterized protein n=1 Tax=Leucogyrophana mollusca TaxID=85980 RepID=A0ACB8B3F7_9AGAM|nr:hypothetical protein BV22DRAFT_1133152 [Leucogyrophana mollusca]
MTAEEYDLLHGVDPTSSEYPDANQYPNGGVWYPHEDGALLPSTELDDAPYSVVDRLGEHAIDQLPPALLDALRDMQIGQDPGNNGALDLAMAGSFNEVQLRLELAAEVESLRRLVSRLHEQTRLSGRRHVKFHTAAHQLRCGVDALHACTDEGVNRDDQAGFPPHLIAAGFRKCSEA